MIEVTQLTLFQWSYEAISFSAFLTILCMLGLYLNHLKTQRLVELEDKNGNESESSEKTSQSGSKTKMVKKVGTNKIINIPWLPMCSIFCFVAYAITNLLATIEILAGTKACYLRIQMLVVSLGISRVLLCNIFILRLALIFEDSAYGYSRNFLIGCRLAVGISGIAFLIMSPWYVYGAHTKLSLCTFQGPEWYMFIYVVFLVGTDSIFLALFLKPLFKVLVTTSDERLRYVAIKCTVLTLTATLSTVIAVMFVASGLDLFHVNRIDDVVQCTCLLLMNNTYKKWYDFLCAGCISCCKSPVIVLEHAILASNQTSVTPTG